MRSRASHYQQSSLLDYEALEQDTRKPFVQDRIKRKRQRVVTHSSLIGAYSISDLSTYSIRSPYLPTSAMHLTTLLSLALLSTSLEPCSYNGGSSLVLGASAQPASIPKGAIYAHKRKRTMHFSMITDRLEEKRQIGAVEDAVGNLVDSAADELSSVVAKVTGGKAAGASSVSVSSAAVTTPPLRTAIVAGAVLSSKIPIVPASSFTSTTSDAVITDDVKSGASSPIDSLITSSRLSSSTTLSTLTTSAETSTKTISNITSSATTSSSSSIFLSLPTEPPSSLTSSARTDSQSSVVYVTSVETVRATSSPSTTSLVDDTTLLKTVFATTSATGDFAASAASQSNTAGDSKGLSTAVIIAISVVGGVVVLAIVLFVIWKLKQRKSGGYDDDADGIKWPELNKHGESSPMPLPAKPTGGHGFETNALEIDEYDTYSAPVSYTNSVNDHYDGYGEELPPVPPLPPGYHMSHGSNSANAHYPGYGEHLHPVPPLPSMYHPDNGHDPYTRSTTPAIGGGTLERSRSGGGYPVADTHNVPLGGTGAFEVDQPEMMAMTGTPYPRGDDNASADLGRSGSGRFL